MSGVFHLKSFSIVNKIIMTFHSSIMMSLLYFFEFIVRLKTFFIKICMGYFTKSISKAKEYQSTELKNLYKFKDIASKLYTYFLNFHTLCWCQQVMATIVYSA